MYVLLRDEMTWSKSRNGHQVQRPQQAVSLIINFIEKKFSRGSEIELKFILT